MGCDYTHNHYCNIRDHLSLAHPNLSPVMINSLILIEEVEDKRCWMMANFGHLSLKGTFKFYAKTHYKPHCPNWIWNVTIPPSKYLFLWRLVHNRLPTYDCIAFTSIYSPLVHLFASSAMNPFNTSSLTMSFPTLFGLGYPNFLDPSL